MSSNAEGNEKRPATDDIVERIRNGGTRCSLGTDFAYPCKPGECCDECDCAREAADEIERLRAENARLQTAGEDLAEALRDARRRHQCDCADGYDERTGALTLAEWEKIRQNSFNQGRD